MDSVERQATRANTSYASESFAQRASHDDAANTTAQTAVAPPDETWMYVDVGGLGQQSRRRIRMPSKFRALRVAVNRLESELRITNRQLDDLVRRHRAWQEERASLTQSLAERDQRIKHLEDEVRLPRTAILRFQLTLFLDGWVWCLCVVSAIVPSTPSAGARAARGKRGL